MVASSAPSSGGRPLGRPYTLLYVRRSGVDYWVAGIMRARVFFEMKNYCLLLTAIIFLYDNVCRNARLFIYFLLVKIREN